MQVHTAPVLRMRDHTHKDAVVFRLAGVLLLCGLPEVYVSFNPRVYRFIINCRLFNMTTSRHVVRRKRCKGEATCEAFRGSFPLLGM